MVRKDPFVEVKWLTELVNREFIEIERDPPYPEAIFQKWKFKHLHRYVYSLFSQKTPGSMAS